MAEVKTNTNKLSPEEESLRMELLSQGLIDRVIGERLGVTDMAINLWRRSRGLPSGTDITNRKRMELYRQGLSDQEIAKQTGATKKRIAGWRYNNKLPRKNRLEPGLQLGPPKIGRPCGYGGISYKKAVPREKWPLIEDFIRQFCRYVDKADEAGVRLNAGRFLTEYRKINHEGCERHG